MKKLQNIILLHGFASSGNSTKARFLRQQFHSTPDVTFHAFDFNPTPTDFTYMTVTGMINRLRQYIVERQLENLSLIGSSMGALVGLNYSNRYGGVHRLLLMAPALSYFSGSREEFAAREVDPNETELVQHYAFNKMLPLRNEINVDGLLYRLPVPPPVPITIIHGRFDDVVPIKHSQQYAAQYPDQVNLIEVDSEHTLNDQLDLMLQQIQQFC
jgi:pimeloyl-ACP methyl ester carboxylesterase